MLNKDLLSELAQNYGVCYKDEPGGIFISEERLEDSLLYKQMLECIEEVD